MISATTLDRYKYQLIPTLEERHEVEAAQALRRLVDEVERLRADNDALLARAATRSNES